MADLNVVNIGALTVLPDTGVRRGPAQGQLDVTFGGAVAIRNGVIVAHGSHDDVMAVWSDPNVPCLDASGKTVIPGLVDAHSHPLFAGHRHDEYAERLAGATLAEVAARGGGIWSSVLATRDASDDALVTAAVDALGRMKAGGVTTVEVKSGYGLTIDSELHQLELLARVRNRVDQEVVITFLGAHVIPRDLLGELGDGAGQWYSDLVAGPMTDAVAAQGIAQFQDVTVEDGLFTPDQALAMMRRSHERGLAVRVHADAWKPSQGWRTAVSGGAVSADHLTYTSDDDIDVVGVSDTVAVVLPVAELIYMTDRRANARRLIDTGVPVAISTDYCSSIHATSLLSTMTMAAPWYGITPAEALVACTLNAAHSLQIAHRCGSLDVGKRGDLLILECPHPHELFLGLADQMLRTVVIAGQVVTDTSSSERTPTP
jgi:imidazolonepropionase